MLNTAMKLNEIKPISTEQDLLLEEDIKLNGDGIDPEVLRKVVTLTEADLTESYDNAEDAMKALLEYCK